MNRKLLLFIALVAGALLLLMVYMKPFPQSTTSPTDPTSRPEVAQSSPPLVTDNSSEPNDGLPKVSEAQAVEAGDLIHWLSDSEVVGVPFDRFLSNAVRLSVDSMKQRSIASREDAVAHLEVNVSMATRPTAAFEGDEFFYFSGGTTAYPVNDFSKGIAVNKATGVITGW